MNLRDVNIYFCIDKYLFVFNGMGRRNIFGIGLIWVSCWFCVPGAVGDVAYAYW